VWDERHAADILTFALSLLLLNLALMLFTANYRHRPHLLFDEAFHLGGSIFRGEALVAFVVAMGLSGALWLFLHATISARRARRFTESRRRNIDGITPARPSPSRSARR